MNESIRLTEELRKLPRNHEAREDKLGVYDFFFHFIDVTIVILVSR